MLPDDETALGMKYKNICTRMSDIDKDEYETVVRKLNELATDERYNAIYNVQKSLINVSLGEPIHHDFNFTALAFAN